MPYSCKDVVSNDNFVTLNDLVNCIDRASREAFATAKLFLSAAEVMVVLIIVNN